jgi:hypothetical protein
MHTQLLFVIICTNFINTVKDMGFEGVTCVQVLSDDADKSWGSKMTELLHNRNTNVTRWLKAVYDLYKKWITQNDGNCYKKPHFILS